MITYIKRAFARLKYPFVFLLIVTGTIGLIAYGQGYIYDPGRGEFVSGGLIVVESDPSNGQVFVDGESIGTTPQRIRRPIGSYHVLITRDGYRRWEKELRLDHSSVADARYPLLVPANVTTDTITSIGELQVFEFNSEEEAFVFVDANNPHVLQGMVVDDYELEELFVLPPELEGFQMQDVSWSESGDALLISSVSEASEEYFWTSLANEQPVSLTELHEGRIDSVAFGPDDNLVVRSQDTLYIYDPEAGQTVSELTQGVRHYGVGNGAVYTIEETATGESAVLRYRNGNERELYQLGRSSGQYEIAARSYRGEDYVVVRDIQRSQAMIISEESDGNYTSRSFRIGAAANFTLSPHGRFLVMHNEGRFMTYDVRLDTIYEFELADLNADIAWHGNYHMLVSDGGNAALVEFDGANYERITSALEYPVYSMRSDNVIYSIGNNTATNEPVLQRSLLE